MFLRRLLAYARHSQHYVGMRTISSDVSVRLYHLDDGDGGAASTLMYGTLGEALAMAATQSEEVQQGLFLQTSNDVVAYLHLIAD